MRPARLTGNFPGRIEAAMGRQARAHRYPDVSAYVIGLLLWDLYCRKPHTLTRPLLQPPSWVLDGFVEDLLVELGEKLKPGAVKPYRFNVSVPPRLLALVKIRATEERYKSTSAYLVSLVLFDLKYRTPEQKGVPHHKTSPLLREPEYIQQAVFDQLATDFGNPERKWPAGIEGRIDELIIKQRELGL